MPLDGLTKIHFDRPTKIHVAEFAASYYLAKTELCTLREAVKAGYAWSDARGGRVKLADFDHIAKRAIEIILRS